MNTKYKDSVFSLLFSNPDLLRELYCALGNVTLPADVPVTINTLQDVLCMDMVNDISFEIGGKLVVLIEHQSTVNPNMALRLLMYIARVYEEIVRDKRNIYTTKPVPIPRPEFFVLYNGTAPYPPEKTLKLSDAFESVAALGLPDKGIPALEPEVKVLNIGGGMNAETVKKSKALSEYASFVGKVQEYEKSDMNREDAIKKAIAYCVENDILKDFLEKNGSEVENMLYTEWNLDEAKEVWFEEGMEKGMEKGMEEGMEKGMEKGMENAARSALANGLSPELIRTITGLDLETIKNLSP